MEDSCRKRRSRGEIGHLPVNPAEERNLRLRKTGVSEQYASATGIVRLAKRALKELPKTHYYLKLRHNFQIGI